MCRDVKKLAEGHGMTLAELSRFFNIPYRTIQNWAYGARECPAYLWELMVYRLEAELPAPPPSRQ